VVFIVGFLIIRVFRHNNPKNYICQYTGETCTENGNDQVQETDKCDIPAEPFG